MTRMDKIRRLLAEDADDVFLNFCLAMELAADGRREEALKQYERVIELDHNYVTAYYRMADLLLESRRDEEARRVLGAGIEAAERTGDHHMRSKLAEMLARLR